MSGPAAVAEEAPVLVGLYMTLEAVLTWLLERALLLVWIFTLGALLKLLANLLTYDKAFIHIHWGGPVRRFESDIHAWLVDQVLAQEYAIGWWWHQTSRIQGWLAHETWAAMRDTFHFGHWLVHTYVPTYVHGLTDALHVATRTIHKTVRVVEHQTTRIENQIRIPHAGELAWIHRHWKQLTHTLATAGSIVIAPPVAIPKIWQEIHGLTRRNLRINKRLHRLEGLLGATAMAAAMANALGLGHNWRCITRGNIGRAARHFCGLDKWLVDLLLLGSVEAFIATDLCEFTHLLGIAAKAQRPALMELVSVENALIGCHGTTSPTPLVLPSADLPPLQGASPLAA